VRREREDVEEQELATLSREGPILLVIPARRI
jgi:hypothetical protein